MRKLWKRRAGSRPTGLRRRCLQIAASILGAFVALDGGRPVSAQSNALGEYQIKAALKDADSPLTYCTIGEDPFHGSLEVALSGKTIGARVLRVQHFRKPQEIQGCQVLFIGAEERKLLPAILAGVKGDSVLTVGESEHFVQDGGMIGFCLEENKIRFEINLEVAQKAKFRISSRLLALAQSVIGGQRGT